MTSRAVTSRAVLLVAAGGAAGTLLRAAALVGTHPVRVTFAVNVGGALALGVLVRLLRSRPAVTQQTLRLLLGTGLLGALTTWSGLVVQTALLVREGRGGAGVLLLVTTLVTGVAAATVVGRAP